MTTMTPAATRQIAGGRHTVTFAGIPRSEWIKLRSLRSTVWSYASVIVVSVAMGTLIASVLNDASTGPVKASTDIHDLSVNIVQSALSGVTFGVLIVAVLGVLVISGEYSTGMIRSTFTAVPKRLPALAGKAVVLFAATFVVGLIANLGAYIGSAAVYGRFDLFDTRAALMLAVGALYLAMVAVLALGIGAMVRSSAGGISTALGLLFLVPTILQFIPAEWAHRALFALPSTAGPTMAQALAGPIPEGPNGWQSFLIVVAWMAVSLALAAILMKRRDA